MGKISTNIGLITGIPITDTVDKLVALQARPRDALANLNTTLQKRQTGYTQLAALLLSLKFTTNKLAPSKVYNEQSIASSNPAALSASITGEPARGSYEFTPLRKVQAQQLTSSKIASSTAALGGGTFSFRFGGFVDPAASLDLLGGGDGLARGKIRITDRTGASAVIDLRYARDVDDVLTAINSSTAIDVTAAVSGDRLRLTDNTGATTANLKVEEVEGGLTAQALGLAGIDTAGATATGADVLRLFDDLALARLNNGLGVGFDDALADLQIDFRDGTSQTLDFQRLAVPGTKPSGTTQGAGGANSRITFTAVTAGSAFAGVSVSFEDDSAIAAGSESVTYDANAKILHFKIDAGATTADQVIEALKRNPIVSPLFTAARATGSDGTGVVSTDDVATTGGPPATAITAGTSSSEAKIRFVAVAGGAAFDNVTISFVDNPSIQAGEETVAYDDSDSQNKKLIFQISAGQSTANHVINALNNNAAAGAVFRAERATGSTGNGSVNTLDTVVTAGGAIVEPVAGTNEQTLGDVLSAFNALDPTRLKAEIAADGDRIVLTDLSVDNGGSLALTDLNGSHVTRDLGLSAASSGATISGRRVLGGLRSTLLTGLAGGQGLADLGLIQLTDRSGATATVDLSAAETLDDVIDALNNSGIGIRASVNKARDGIVITDTTGQGGNLVIANGDATNTAERLGIAVNAGQTTVDGGSLNLAVVNEHTTLASLNGGLGVAQGFLTITDTSGASAKLNVGAALATVGDVIHEIARLGINVTARVNDAGDGIVLVDTAHGSGTLSVTEGSGTTAADLHLLATATTSTIEGEPTQTIDGSTTVKVTLTASQSLEDLVTKINASKAGVQAAIFNDGSTVKPYRFTLTSKVAGKAGELRVDASDFTFDLVENAKARDALLLVGGQEDGHLVSSSTNKFKDVLAGASIEIKDASATPVTVTVGGTDTTLVSTAIAIVDSYNRLRDALDELTAFNAESGESAVLQGDTTALRIETQIAGLFTTRHFGLGSIQSVQSLGFKLGDDGRMTLDQDTFKAKFAADPDAVRKFLSTEKTGLAAKLDTLVEQLAGDERSLLGARSAAMDHKLQTNIEKIAFYNQRLESTRNRLLLQFYRSEVAISKIQSNLNAIASLQSLVQTRTQ